MRTFAVVNQKGGSGKTTTAINLAAVWAASGKRTLLIDMDPQSHCATGLAVPEDAIETHIGDAILSRMSQPADLAGIAWRISTNLDLVPSTMQLAGIEAMRGGLADRPDRDLRLAVLIRRVARRYDACIIDCPPSIGLLTYNALRAAGEVIIPVETGYFALQGAHRQVNTIRSLAQRFEREIRYYLLPTLHRSDSRLASEILATLKNRFVTSVTPIVIHYDERLREAAGFGQSIVEYAPGSVGHRDYAALGVWLDGECKAIIEPKVPIVELAKNARASLLQSIAGSDRQSPLGSEAPARIAPPIHVRTVEPMNGGCATAAPVAAMPTAAVETGRRTMPASRAAELASRARMLADRSASLKHRLSKQVVVKEKPAQETAVEPKAHMLSLLGPHHTSMGVSFAYGGDAAESLFIAGDFNDWSPHATPLTFHPEHGVWHACIPLTPGRHSYRYVRNGDWIIDPHNDIKEPNPFGEENSVVEVSEPQPACEE